MLGYGPSEWFLVFNLGATLCCCVNGVSEVVSASENATSESVSEPSVD